MRADGAAAQDVALDAHDREVRGWRSVCGDRVRRRSACPAAPMRVAADAARQAAAADDRHLACRSRARCGGCRTARACRLRVAAAAAATPAAAAERERALVLEEELALLREEQAEAREVDLLLVGFDLREVGVVGEVGRQALRDAALRVEPKSRWRRRRSRRRIVDGRRRRRCDRSSGRRCAYGLISRLRRSRRRFEADQRRHRATPRSLPRASPNAGGTWVRYAISFFHLSVRRAWKPQICARPGAIAERLERNGRLERPAALERADRDVPDRIPVGVVLPLVRALPVGAAAERVDLELDGVAAIVERVEARTRRRRPGGCCCCRGASR